MSIDKSYRNIINDFLIQMNIVFLNSKRIINKIKKFTMFRDILQEFNKMID